MEAFQLRLWDGRIGRWLSVDPYGQYHSPYLGMGNNPVNNIDPDGGFDTWFGAFLSWVGNGFQGSIGKNDHGTYYHAHTAANGDYVTTYGRNSGATGKGYTTIPLSNSNLGSLNSNSIPCVKCHHDAMVNMSTNGLDLSWLEPNSGSIMYGTGGGDFGRGIGQGGVRYPPIDTTNLLSPGGFNGGGGTLLNGTNFLAQFTKGFKHVASSAGNSKALYDNIPDTLSVTLYTLKDDTLKFIIDPNRNIQQQVITIMKKHEFRVGSIDTLRKN